MKESHDSQFTKDPVRGINQRIKGMLSEFARSVKTVASNVPLIGTVEQCSRIPGGVMTLKRFVEELVKLSTESEDTHRNMWGHANSDNHSQRFPYYRFNVPSGMKEIGLEEWKNMTRMKALTRGYIRTPSVEKEIAECIASLHTPSSFEST